jgi:hypothetical protein
MKRLKEYLDMAMELADAIIQGGHENDILAICSFLGFAAKFAITDERKIDWYSARYDYDNKIIVIETQEGSK